MKTSIYVGAALLALGAFAVSNAFAFPGDNGRSGGNGSRNAGSGNAAGGNTSGGNSASGHVNNNGGNGSNANTSSGNTSSGHSNSAGSSGNHVRTDNGSGGSSNGSSHSSTSKIQVNPNPVPKDVHSNHSDDAHHDKDHAHDVHTDSSKHTSTSHDHSDHTVDSKHFHSNPKFAYHHQSGKSWDKDEWQHCWSRWWYFHNNHVFYNGNWCWWDPDVLQWTVYTEGDSIPEDYLVKGETPPVGNDVIRIGSPVDLDATLSYAVNEFPFQIKPGTHQELPTDRTWVIAFNRGGDFGNAEYTLEPGEYTFGPSDHGWDLFRAAASEDPAGPATAEGGLPKNPLPK